MVFKDYLQQLTKQTAAKELFGCQHRAQLTHSIDSPLKAIPHSFLNA